MKIIVQIPVCVRWFSIHALYILKTHLLELQTVHLGKVQFYLSAVFLMRILNNG